VLETQGASKQIEAEISSKLDDLAALSLINFLILRIWRD